MILLTGCIKQADWFEHLEGLGNKGRTEGVQSCIRPAPCRLLPSMCSRTLSIHHSISANMSGVL